MIWTPLAIVGGAAVGRLTAQLAEPYCKPSRARIAGIALATGLVSGLLAWRFGVSAELVAYLYFGVVGTLLAFIDVEVKRLPDPFTLPSYPVGAALLGVAALTEAGARQFLGAILGMAALWTFYAVQHFFFPDAMGRGDVKLAGVVGLYLGWLGQDAWMTGVLAGALLAGVPSIVLLATRRVSRKTSIPMGPFMLVGALIAILTA